VVIGESQSQDAPGAHDQRGPIEEEEARDRRHRESVQPPTHGACRRHDLHLAEPLEQRVVLDEGEMPQASAPNQEQPDHQAHHRHGADVAPALKPVVRKYCPNNSRPAYEVSATSANSSWRSPLTRARKSVWLRLTSGGPFGVATEEWVAPSFTHNERPFSIAMRCLSLGEMSHQGLIPDSLRDDQKKLIFQYDQWLQEYDRVRIRRPNDPEQAFVFVYSFPEESAQRFRDRIAQVEALLGREGRCG
jgi:hypothetical protein